MREEGAERRGGGGVGEGRGQRKSSERSRDSRECGATGVEEGTRRELEGRRRKKE